MKLNTRRVGAAAFALVVCLSISPVAVAAPGDRFEGVRSKIAKILKKLKVPLIWTLEDDPAPPHPKP